MKKDVYTTLRDYEVVKQSSKRAEAAEWSSREMSSIPKRFNPDQLTFEEVVNKVTIGYGLTCIQNGQRSECVRHLRTAIGTGTNGMMYATEELVNIKQHSPENYEYILERVYSLK